MKGLIDIHCHMLPCVDDGPQNRKVSMEMLRQAYYNGTRAIIMTPHFRGGMFMTSKEDILEQYMIFKSEAAKASSKLNIYLGQELYYHTDIVERLNREDIFTLADSGYILVEFAVKIPYMEMKQGLYRLLAGGYVPILAHIERYEVLLKDIGMVEDLIEMGVYIQANAVSLLEQENSRQKKFLKVLIQEGLLHLVASDAHDSQYRMPGLKEAYLLIAKKYGTGAANDLLIRNPERIIRNEYI